MAKQYRVGAFVRFNNGFMRALLRTDVRFGTFAILIVPGRRTGRPIHNPLVVFPDGENRYLVASYGMDTRPDRSARCSITASPDTVAAQPALNTAAVNTAHPPSSPRALRPPIPVSASVLRSRDL
jgi:hypothetical protein